MSLRACVPWSGSPFSVLFPAALGPSGPRGENLLLPGVGPCMLAEPSTSLRYPEGVQSL